MLRRSHNKSRRGCLECFTSSGTNVSNSKRRHVKCDEARPRCRLCVVCEKECSFTTQAQSQTKLAPVAIARSAHPNTETSNASSSAGYATPPHSTPPQISHSPLARSEHGPSVEDTVNFNHLELLAHYQPHPEMFNLSVNLKDPTFSRLAILFESTFAAPYMMYELLAFSARHLAYLRPDRSASYLKQAASFQTRAISLFTAKPIEVDETNCVSVLLFSSALGYHLLADALSHREPARLDSFIDNYVQFVTNHRGVYHIAISAWPLLMESKLADILKTSANSTALDPIGNDSQRALEMVDGTLDLNPAEKKACKEAISYIQVGLDALSIESRRPEAINPHQMILEWTMLISPEFTALLAAKRPVSLVILAHYAILLHHGRHLWQIADSGAHMLGLIKEFLGTRYDYWLELPQQIIFAKPD